MTSRGLRTDARHTLVHDDGLLAEAIACKLEQKRVLVAAMSDVPELAGREMMIGARHGLLLLLRPPVLPLKTRL